MQIEELKKVVFPYISHFQTYFLFLQKDIFIKMKRPEITNRLITIIRSTSPDAKVILYGSEARGDARPDSDIDLLILLDKEKVTFNDQRRIAYPLYDVELDTGISISPLIYSRQEWENRTIKSPFL